MVATSFALIRCLMASNLDKIGVDVPAQLLWEVFSIGLLAPPEQLLAAFSLALIRCLRRLKRVAELETSDTLLAFRDRRASRFRISVKAMLVLEMVVILQLASGIAVPIQLLSLGCLPARSC